MRRLRKKDKELLLWIQENLRTESMTGLMKVVTFLGDSGWFWIALAIALFSFRKTRRIGLCTGLALLIGAFITNIILKPLIKRTRPYEEISDLQRLIEAQEDKSFPSGHTTASFAAAGIVYMMVSKRWGQATMMLASLVGYSRMYLGVHYLTDVLAGVSVGLGSAMIVEEIDRVISSN